MKKFWQWYERHYVLNVTVAALLFVLQLIHLYWLTKDVVVPAFLDVYLEPFSALWRTVIIFVDYAEIPALVSTSLVYIHALRIGLTSQKFKNVLYLLFLNSQWLHIFWITDEFVIEALRGTTRGTVLPLWLAWVAIGIDYLELPVIIETIKRAWVATKERSTQEFKPW